MAVAATLLVGCGGRSTTPSAHGPGTAVAAATTVPTTALAAPTTTSTTAEPPATTAATTPKTAPAPVPTHVTGGGVAVGDSVLEDVQIYAQGTLASKGISINAAVSRQWSAGVSILSQLRAGGKVPPVVIVGLGSNGVVNASQFDQMMQAATGAKRVVFMTVTGPLVANNPVITAGVSRFANATLADWAALAAAHPGWFGPDHVHIGPAGAAALGNLLASKI